MATFYSPKVVTDGLVLALDAANIKSYSGTGTTWSDLSGNGNTGTLTNGPTFDSGNGGSIVFDGVDDVVNTSFAGSVNDLTVECWFNGTKTARNHLWNFGSGGTSGHNLNCNFNDSGYDLWMYWDGGGTNRVRYNIDGSFTDSTNKLITFTHTSTTNKVFLNGSELTITESGGTQSFANVNATGVFNLGSVGPFSGKIFRVVVYNRALTPQEILQNFNATRSRFGV
jgi:hypothetical protein